MLYGRFILCKMSGSMRHNKVILFTYFSTLIGICIWIGAIISAPFLEHIDSPFGPFLYAAFAPVCHQVDSRCFFLFGFPMAVCTRCFGIYSGFLLGTLSYPMIRGTRELKLPSSIGFLLVSLPIVLDTIGNFFDLWSTPAWTRFIIGCLWGYILPFYFITGVGEYIFHLKGRKKKSV